MPMVVACYPVERASSSSPATAAGASFCRARNEVTDSTTSVGADGMS